MTDDVIRKASLEVFGAYSTINKASLDRFAALVFEAKADELAEAHPTNNHNLIWLLKTIEWLRQQAHELAGEREGGTE